MAHGLQQSVRRSGGWAMRHRRWLKRVVSIGSSSWLILAVALMLAPPARAGAPASVNTLTIAMDGWGSDMIDPWENPQPSFIQSYLNLRLITRDENMRTTICSGMGRLST